MAHFALRGKIIEMFLHSVIFIEWMYCDRWGPKNLGLSVYVCVCVCLRVCLRQYSVTTGPISNTFSPNGLFPIGIVVCVCVLAYWHDWRFYGPQVWMKKRLHCHAHICVCVCVCFFLIENRFSISFQCSSSSYSCKNGS